jgi:hypothetical protein
MLISDLPATRPDRLRPVQRAAAQRDRAAGAVRRAGQGGDRAGLLNATPLAPGFLDQLTSSIGIVLNSIEATMQTEACWPQSKITVDVNNGEIPRAENTINNDWVVQLERLRPPKSPAWARGRQPRQLGGQPASRRRRNLEGPTVNVNFMASNLTGQVRNIAELRPPSPAATCRRRSPWTCAAKSCC